MMLFQPQPQPTKRGRSSEDFLMFCKMILDYENYEDSGDSALRYRHTSSPMGSTASTGSSLSLGSAGETREEAETSPRLPLPRQGSDTETDTVTGNIRNWCFDPSAASLKPQGPSSWDYWWCWFYYRWLWRWGGGGDHLLLPKALRWPPDDRVQLVPDLGPPDLCQGQALRHPRHLVLLSLQTKAKYKDHQAVRLQGARAQGD